jgi:hypothetical protein
LPNKPTIAANIFMNGDNIANVRKDLDQSAWEWGVDNALKNLMQIAPFQSSQPVLQQIAQARKRILIRPAHAGEETHSDPVAGIDSYDYTTDDVIDATPQGSPPLACAEGPVANRDLTSTPRFRQGDSWDPKRLGTGTGSDVCLYFTSQDHLKELMKAGGRPDEVLLHELVHSLRMMLGCSFCMSMPDDYDTVEEFHAILIANIYRSECGYTNLARITSASQIFPILTRGTSIRPIRIRSTPSRTSARCACSPIRLRRYGVHSTQFAALF